MLGPAPRLTQCRATATRTRIHALFPPIASFAPWRRNGRKRAAERADTATTPAWNADNLWVTSDAQSARLDASLRTLSQQIADQKTEIQTVNEELSKKIDAIPDVDEKIAIAKVDKSYGVNTADNILVYPSV